MIHKLRSWLHSAPPESAILQLDFRNAYNTLNRTAILQSIGQTCPLFLPYARACYAQSASLYAPGFVLESQQGIHQGCPCGPLFFAVTCQPLTKIPSQLGCLSLFYLDDGHIAGPTSALPQALSLITSEAQRIGLQLNASKCVLFQPSGTHITDQFMAAIPRIPSNACLPVLGSPIGPLESAKDWVASKVIKPLQLALTRLESLGDPHSASLVLRQCFSACKVNWVLRTAEPACAAWTADQVTPLIRNAWETILGTNVGDAQWDLATLPIRMGGCGITSPLTVCEAASVSSWLSATASIAELSPSTPEASFLPTLLLLANKAPNLGRPLVDLLSSSGVAGARQHPLWPKWCQQHAWADEINTLHSTTLDTSVIERLSSLRKLQATPSAGLWLTRSPGNEENSLFTAKEWQSLLRFRTGVPLFESNSSCQGCGSPLDPFGDHALCCASNGLYRRHNRVRDALFSATQDAGWRPALEMQLPGQGSRPADVLLQSYHSCPVAVDVVVTHPLRLSAEPAMRGVPSATATQAEAAKNAAQLTSCEAAGWEFIPFGVEATGALGKQAAKLLRELHRKLSMRHGVSIDSVSTNLGSQISSALAKGRAEMLVAASKIS